MSARPPLSWEEAVRSLLMEPGREQIVRDCYFDQPNTVAAQRYASGEEWLNVSSRLPPQRGVAADIGSGQGITAFALATARFEVIAVEPDSSDLVGRGAVARLAADTGLPIHVISGTAESIPLPDSHCDLAVARQVLHHAHDLGAACREIHRILKPGGTFIAIRDHVVSRTSDLPKFLESHPMHWMYGGEHAFLLEEYVRALRNAGFEIVELLRSFDSAINYAPHTRETLRAAMMAAAGRIPLGRPLLSFLLRSEKAFDRILAVASWVDRRPGRLVSFVCRRPRLRNDG